jgi:hypothetical protein
MLPTRVVLFLALTVFCCGSALGQRPGPEFWRKVGCQPYEPRTKLEAIDERYSIVIVKAYTRITTIEVNGVVLDAVDMREIGGTERARGLVVSVRGNAASQQRAFVDYDEIDPLLNAIDTMSRVDETTTRTPGFEARYRTLGDLEIGVFRQTRSGVAVTLTAGICDRATQTMTLDELAKLKAMIQEGKTRLDENK